MKAHKIVLTLTEELLGTAPANPDIFDDWVASKSPEPDKTKAEEVAALPDVDEEVKLATTVFARGEDGRPCLWDYQIKGFFKDACSMMRRVPDSLSKKLTAYKKVIDGLVFVTPRLIPIAFEGDIGFCIRPLRAQTAQGERIALARSETVPAGATIELTIDLLDDKLDGVVDEWLDYGRLRGLGQWRNAGKGRFIFRDVDSCDTADIKK